MLSQANIARLIGNLSPGARAETAASVAGEFARGQLTEAERGIAIDLLNILAHDVEEQVRIALVEHVKRCPFLPPDVARTLAADIGAVAIPVLRYSMVLSDDDLIAVVRNGSTDKRLAVAQRERVGERVADALVEVGERQVVGALLENAGAQIAEASLYKVMQRFEDDAGIHALMAERSMLPLTVIERLITAVSEELRERIIERHGFPRQLADELVLHGRERALTGAMAEKQPDDVGRLVASLHERDALTPTLVLRALCEGNVEFFDLGMAKLAGIPLRTARILIHDAGPLGLKGIYRKGGLPSELFRAFRVAVDEMLQLSRRPTESWGPEVTERILERVAAEYGHTAPAELESMLSLLWRRVGQQERTAEAQRA